jgi:hypothetical protein
MSLREIAAALNARGIATARGGRWEAQTVANVLRRAACSSGGLVAPPGEWPLSTHCGHSLGCRRK